MDPNAKLFVTNRGSIQTKKGLRLPGDVILASEFRDHQANLQELLRVGALSLQPVQGRKIDGERVPVGELAQPLASEIDLKTGAGVPRSVPGNDGHTLARLKEIREAALAREEAGARRQKALADLEGVELTVEEAKALNVVS